LPFRRGLGLALAPPVEFGFRGDDDPAADFDLARPLLLPLQVVILALGNRVALAKAQDGMSVAGLALAAALTKRQAAFEFAFALVRVALLLTFAGGRWLASVP